MTTKKGQRLPLLVAGCVFALVALVHLWRIIYKIDITFAGQVVSMNVSYIGLVIALILSIWMFVSSSK